MENVLLSGKSMLLSINISSLSLLNAFQFVSSTIVASYGLYKISSIVYWYGLRRRTDLHKRYGKDSWCIVTGASSGIGATFAYELATKYKYKVILVARRGNNLDDVNKKILDQNPDAVTRVVPYDLSSLGTEEEEYGAKFASKISEIVKDEGVSIVGEFCHLELLL